MKTEQEIKEEIAQIDIDIKQKVKLIRSEKRGLIQNYLIDCLIEYKAKKEALKWCLGDGD